MTLTTGDRGWLVDGRGDGDTQFAYAISVVLARARTAKASCAAGQRHRLSSNTDLMVLMIVDLKSSNTDLMVLLIDDLQSFATRGHVMECEHSRGHYISTNKRKEAHVNFAPCEAPRLSTHAVPCWQQRGTPQRLRMQSMLLSRCSSQSDSNVDQSDALRATNASPRGVLHIKKKRVRSTCMLQGWVSQPYEPSRRRELEEYGLLRSCFTVDHYQRWISPTKIDDRVQLLTAKKSSKALKPRERRAYH